MKDIKRGVYPCGRSKGMGVYFDGKIINLRLALTEIYPVQQACRASSGSASCSDDCELGKLRQSIDEELKKIASR